MSKTIVTTPNAPATIGPYSQAVKANGFVYTSGIIPLDPESMTVVADSIEAQAKRVMESLKALLEDSGSSLGQVVKTSCFLTDLGNFSVFNEVYGTYFDADSAPARSTFQVAGLPMGVLIEVEAIALL